MKSHENIIEMHGIYKKFPGVVAVDNVDFNLIRGEIHSLLGENGAGKSTLMKILYGYYRPDRGRIFVDGREVRFRSPSDAIKYGIGMVFQHFNLVDSLTVLENIILGDDNLGFIPDYSSARKRVIEIINEYGFKLDPDTEVGYLSVGEKQRVEIIKLLYQDSRVMIFDEPTTVLTPAEKSTLFNFFYNVSNEDRSIIFITHKLEEAMNVSDRITVMKRGKVVATLKPEETDINELARLMVGRIEPYEIRRSSRRGKTILKINGLWVKDDLGRFRVKGTSIEVREGEIVGIAGVAGNGQKELIEAIIGIRKVYKGSIYVFGEDITNMDPSNIFSKGVIIIPEDRNYEGLFMDASVYENLISRVYRESSNKLGFMDHDGLRKYALKLIDEYGIQTPDITIPVKALSGGNRQRVVLAREFSYNEDRKNVIIAVYPSRGLDIKATNFVRTLLMREREKGLGILLVSDDLDEVFELSDRILVMNDGVIIREFEGGRVSEEELGLAISGVK